MAESEIIKTDTGFALQLNGETLVYLDGEEGALKPRFPDGPGLQDAKQDCFDKCFANSDGSLGASKKCSKKCGLE